MINLNSLKYLVDASQHKSLSKAAKVNYVSSSAISQSIKTIETYYEIEIFSHGKNKFEVTPKGELFIEKAKSLLSQYHKFDSEINLISQTDLEEFHFSTQQSIANIILSKTIKELNENYPKKKLTVSTGTSYRCREWLEQGEISYSLSIDNVKFDSNLSLIKKGNFVIISAKNDKRSVTEAGIITTEDTDEVIELKRQYYQKYKTKAPIINQVSSWGLISKMAIAGLGMAYVPDYILKSLNRNEYRIKKIDFKLSTYNLNFYYPKHMSLDSYQKRLIQHFRHMLK